MAVTLDLVTKASAAAVTSLTISHTVSGTNTGMIACTDIRGSTASVSSIAYAAVALAFEQIKTITGTNILTAEQRSLIAPASGANNIVWQMAATLSFVGACISVNGANQTTLVSAKSANAKTSTTTIAVSITSNTNEYYVSTIAWADANATDLPTETPGTSQWGMISNNLVGGAGASSAGQATVTSQWVISPLMTCSMCVLSIAQTVISSTTNPFTLAQMGAGI